MIGIMDLCNWNGVVYEYVVWRALLNGACVGYSDRRIG